MQAYWKVVFFSLPISIFAMVDSGAKIKWPATATAKKIGLTGRKGKMQTNREMVDRFVQIQR